MIYSFLIITPSLLKRTNGQTVLISLSPVYINIREWEKVQVVPHSARRRIVRRRSIRKIEEGTIPNLTVLRKDHVEKRRTERRTGKIRNIVIVPNQTV